MLVLATLLFLVADQPKPLSAEVKLPLREYLALVEKIEAIEAARADARAKVEPAVAELVSQRLALTLGDQDADATTTYEIEIRGQATEPVSLPLTGMAYQVTVDPPGPAAVRKADGGLSLVAPGPGRYRVQARGKAPVTHNAGLDNLTIAAMTAPVAEVEVSMPAGRAWKCAGAVVADEVIKDSRRTLRLALARGHETTFETRRDVKRAEPSKPLAAAVVVTVLGIGRDATRRHDIILYEVARGEIGTMAVTLPAGLELDRVVTDEGEVTPWIEGRELRVERSRRLTGSGYLAILSQSTGRDSIPLDPIVLESKIRARYLAFASDVAATVEPEPLANWTRVDLTDLPAPVRDASGALGLVAAWRLRRDDSPGQLKVAAMPAPKLLEGVVKERNTLTLLTVEGTLLHRDRFVLEGEGAFFEVVLPSDGTPWSAQVDDVPVRPLERAGRIVVPLGARSAATTNLEVVIVQQKAVPSGRSTLNLSLPEVTVPVLAHTWRLLLPERNRYRYLNGDLDPAGEREILEAPPPSKRDRAAGKKAIMIGGGGNSNLRGRVMDESGAAIPGVTVVVREKRTGRALTLMSDAEGDFHFTALPAGVYSLDCSLTGFQPTRFESFRVEPDDNRAYAVVLRIGAMEETIEIMGAQPPPLHAGTRGGAGGVSDKDMLEAQRRQEFREQANALKQGLVGGVKPLPVAIPEAGKVLFLAGALPPSRVTVELAVKAPKK